MTAPCDHTMTSGRPGETGSYCMGCGILVMQVHDRPCGECRHFRLDMGARVLGSCGPKLMAVTSGMHVTYYVEGLADNIGRPGLCFESATANGSDPV